MPPVADGHAPAPLYAGAQESSSRREEKALAQGGKLEGLPGGERSLVNRGEESCRKRGRFTEALSSRRAGFTCLALQINHLILAGITML